MSDQFKNDQGRPILLAMVKAIRDNKDVLSDVDGRIGDGDHGANMSKGFTMYAEQLGDEEVSLADGLYDLGSVLFNRIGGSMGPIYGALFMGMSSAIEDAEDVDLSLVCKMLETGYEELLDIVDARPGDKTLVDTLDGALTALRAAAAAGKPLSQAMEDMAAGAQKGRDATVDMVAKYGRASRLGERSRGVPDAGACSCCLMLQAMAGAIGALL